MSKCLVTFGLGEHAELLEIALPSFERFADRHGYDLVVAEPAPSERPPSWRKVLVLQEALASYEEALWVDSDVVIVDVEDDLGVREGAWQAFVEHHTGDGHVPNLGVWLVRSAMRSVLDEVWARDEYVEHGWWEQAAMLDLLGYRHEPRPSVLKTPSPLYARTHFLETGWNVHPYDMRKSARPRFMHATMYRDRAGVMREWAEGALACAS